MGSVDGTKDRVSTAVRTEEWVEENALPEDSAEMSYPSYQWEMAYEEATDE